ncbi:MAG: matrixin family metalloprotease [Nitrososphaeraceae archaeon]
MAVDSNRNSGDENVGSVRRNRKGRNYIYIGILFTIFAILATGYLSMMTLSGSFLQFNGLDWVTNLFPFYDNVYNEAEFDAYSGKDIILLCCSWGDELADGEITYFIGHYLTDEGSNRNSYEVDRSSIEAVTKAFKEWDSKIEGLTFTETPTRRGADVEIYFREVQNEKAGITNNFYDFYGFITKSYVLISKGAFGFAFSGNQMERIVKHEIGHVLGLGHANFDGNLMFVQVNRGIGSVSGCEVEAVYAANEWWFNKPPGSQPLFIRQPTTDHIDCR